MRSVVLVCISSVLLSLFCLSCDQDREKASPQDECLTKPSINHGKMVEGQYIVSYRNDLGETATLPNGRLADASAAILSRNQLKGTPSGHFGGLQAGFVCKLTAPEAQRLRQDPEVIMVEPDRIVSIASCFTVVEPRRISWSTKRVGYGDGVATNRTAWVIDTGIDLDHPDLNVDQTRSRSFVEGKSADDENGHGTHVAGIIGALNNRIGLLGVASGARLVALKVLNQSGEGYLSNVIAAVAYVGRTAKAGDVVNLSLGGEGISSTLEREVQNAAQKGILFAIAAGNEAASAVASSPGRLNYQNVFTVSAMDSTDNWASFSNYGADIIDYCAPGVRIPSTYLNGQYAIMSGTSMAAPHLAGLLLLNGRQLTTSGYVRNDPDGKPDPIPRN